MSVFFIIVLALNFLIAIATLVVVLLTSSVVVQMFDCVKLLVEMFDESKTKQAVKSSWTSEEKNG